MAGPTQMQSIAALCVSHNVPPRLPAREVRTTWVTLENTGSRAWSPGTTRIELFLDGQPIVPMALPAAVATGERVTLHGVFRLADAPGRHEISVHISDDTAGDSGPRT